MLDVSVLLNEQTSNKKRTIQVHRMFDVTERKKVSHSDGDITCSWEITDETKATITVEAQICENKEGASKEIAHPVLVLSPGKKGEIRLGDKTKSSTGETEERNLNVSVVVTQE